MVRLIGSSKGDPALQVDLLRGTLESVAGRRRMAMPTAWPEAYPGLAEHPNDEIRTLATRLALVFGDPSAFASLRRTAAAKELPPARRVEAIEALARARDERLSPILHRLIHEPPVAAAALRGLAASDDPKTPGAILAAYLILFAPEARAEAVATLAARPAWALELLAAIDRGAIPKDEVPPASIQALAQQTDPRVKAALAKTFGATRPTPEAKRSRIAGLKAELAPLDLSKADLLQGRLLFTRTCASCHVLFGSGSPIGPELTGSQRSNLDYILTNVVDPSAVVGRDYQVSVFETNDGRVVSGIVRREDERSVTVQSANDLVVIPKPEIESRRTTNLSLMPEGLLDALSRDEIIDLIAYLASPGQVPLP